MKAILISIKPQHVANILNLIKLWEIRKRFPSDYVGWVYIYCTKDQNEELWWYDGTEDFRLYKKGIANERDIGWHLQNGKVVARFWCDKVEEISIDYSPTYETGKWASHYEYRTNSMYDYDLKEKSCLSFKELDDYLLGGVGYAIHITNLEIFDEPKEISEFETRHWNSKNPFERDNVYELTCAPQSWQFIEVDL